MEPQQPQQPQPAAAWQQPTEDVGPAPGIRFAGHGARLVAYILDGILLSVLWFAILAVSLLFFGFATNDRGEITSWGGGIAALLFFLAFAISIGYFPFFWARGGATPGMKVFNLRVVRDRDGGPITAGQAIMRLVGYWINGVVLYIGFAWILVDKRRRGWHDLIAGTVVIQG